MPSDITAAPPPNQWEEAYLRFETPEQEVRKFARRLRQLGAGEWPREARIVELFCGRGNGLLALTELGFIHAQGIDLSPSLAAQYRGPGRIVVGDCRELPFATASQDALIVQGGLHHLPLLPNDLDQTLVEARRVLKDGGRFCVVEPWPTPFLSFAHALCRSRALRRLAPKIDALAIMIENERETYEQWLSQPGLILEILSRHFRPQRQSMAWGKLLFVGRK